MRRVFLFATLAALLALVIFVWSTAGVVQTRDTTALQDSLTAASGKSAVSPDSASGTLDTLASASSRTTPFRPDSPYRIIIPVEGIRPGQLVDTYNAARSEDRRHNAIDIIAPRGTRVLAAADGRIARLFTSEQGGLTIYQLASDARTVYYYAHLSGYAPGLHAGRNVRQGEHIGFVGDTGNAVPGNYHLHFAIWSVADTTSIWNGRPVNPYPLLQSTR